MECFTLSNLRPDKRLGIGLSADDVLSVGRLSSHPKKRNKDCCHGWVVRVGNMYNPELLSRSASSLSVALGTSKEFLRFRVLRNQRLLCFGLSLVMGQLITSFPRLSHLSFGKIHGPIIFIEL